MANVAPRSKIMWAHWSCCLLFLAWTLMLLEWHFKQYVSLRHFYLRANTGVNFWRSLHLAAADGVGVHKRVRVAELISVARANPMLKVRCSTHVAHNLGLPLAQYMPYQQHKAHASVQHSCCFLPACQNHLNSLNASHSCWMERTRRPPSKTG